VAAAEGREDRLAGSLVTVATAGGAAAPHRHPDGAVFLAKPAQHLLEVRTAVARTGEAAASREIVGRVIADPNGFGRVQALRDGRIAAPDSGFPHLGQSVTQGEVLAVLIPTLSSFEEASLRERLAQVERDMAALVPRADAIGQVNPNMPMSDAAAGVLQELQIQSQGLRRQHELLKAALEHSHATRIGAQHPGEDGVVVERPRQRPGDARHVIERRLADRARLFNRCLDVHPGCLPDAIAAAYNAPARGQWAVPLRSRPASKRRRGRGCSRSSGSGSGWTSVRCRSISNQAHASFSVGSIDQRSATWSSSSRS